MAASDKHARPLILASRSPRRRGLLDEAGYPFEVIEPALDEEPPLETGETPAGYVMRLALVKARDVAGRIESGTIVACDTIAECGGQILGKPLDRADARRMLAALSGQRHHVWSGVCVWRVPEGEPRSGTAKSTLYMEPLDDAQLEAYLDSGAWQGKAGAFGYQDNLSWVRLLDGSPSNVVGLPLELLAELLTAAGAA